jgi:hypothetical protein
VLQVLIACMAELSSDLRLSGWIGPNRRSVGSACVDHHFPGLAMVHHI